MNPDVIQFACGHCQSWLTVPAHMAGVAGPCPKCGNHIVSPPASQAPSFDPPQAQVPAPPPMGQMPQQRPPAWGSDGLNPPEGYAPPAPAPSYLPPPVQPPGPMAHEIFPPAPAAAPMVPPPAGPVPWGQPPVVAQPAPDNGLPGGYPLHSLGPRSNAGLPQPVSARGTALPPPVAPLNPIAGAMGQMPMPPAGMPYDQGGQAGMLTRPASVGGSRLSLLARQLTTPSDGVQGLPVAPAPLSTSELPGQAPALHAAPDGSRNQHVGDMMLKQSMRRGLSSHRTRSHGKVKFALAFLLILGLLGGLVWQYRAPLKEIVEQVFPPKPALPETVTPPSNETVPGVSKVASAAPAENQPRTAAVKQAPPKPEGAGSPPEDVKDLRAGPDSSAPSRQAKADAGEEEVKKPGPLPQAEPPPGESAPSQTSKVKALLASRDAPRATPVDDNDSSPPVPPPPAKGAAPEGQPPKLVEVGRATSSETKSAQSSTSAPPPAVSPGLPVIKKVPAAAKPALDGLLGFLNARNWRERQKYVQLPEQMEPKLKLYYSNNPDGPVDVDEIEFLRQDDVPQVGKGMHAVFVLFSRSWGYAFPVMVEVTSDGARVDWLTFIECKDDMLNKFLSNYMEERVQFHVGIHRTHYFDDNIPNLDKKDHFAITSPMEDVRGFVFVPKGTPLARSLAGTISWDKDASFVVVELQWRKEGTSKWVEMTGLPQLNWYSSGTAATTDAGSRPAPAPPGSTAR